ncbi:DedA protein [hydrothermal vent metagenome]|uniref:DedA protein n=1 Tax=hydrothermal vent metagenome TaxID=652676 RepID=A0A3B0UMU1_9ZZZZ
MLDFFRDIMVNPVIIVTTAGYIGIFSIVFAESGFLIGLFLPGDSLLFAAGLVASNGTLNPLWLIAIVIAGAILGDTTGYWIGRHSGERILRRYPRIVKPEYIIRTERFYERFGTRAIILARFVPIVRTVMPPLAGIAHMDYERFLRANVIGAFLWSPIMISLGYFLGRSVPGTEQYLLPISLGIIFISFLPFLIRFIMLKTVSAQT